MTSLQERVWRKVDKSGDCWIWLGSLGAGGRYGSVYVGGPRKMRIVHRLTYEWANGPVPEGLELDHLCREPRCVRPEHLEPVSHQENMRRGVNATRPNCIKGHPLTATSWGRVCRTCRREANRLYRRRHGLVRDAA